MPLQKRKSTNFHTIAQLCEAQRNVQIFHTQMFRFKFHQMIRVFSKTVSVTELNYINIHLNKIIHISIWKISIAEDVTIFVCVFVCVSSYSISADKIDEATTKWGDVNTCLLYYYLPVIEITVVIVWIVLIFISRREDERSAFKYVYFNLLHINFLLILL